MKKSILTILALSMILITTSSNVVLGSEQKHVSYLSSIERVESIQEKKELYNKHLALIDNANQNLSEAEKQLNDTSIEQAQKAINEVPRLFQGKLLDRLNKAKDSKLALEEKRRLEEEAAALAAKKEAEAAAKEKQEQTKKVADQGHQVVASNKSAKNSSSPSKSNVQTSDSSKDKAESTKSNSNNLGNNGVKIETKNARKVREGDIKNHAGTGESGRTYEEWTFDLTDDFPSW